MTTPFLIVCAVMALIAVALLARPLLGRSPATEAGVAARALPTSLVVFAAVPIAAALLYTSLSTFSWNEPPHAANMGEGAQSQPALAEAAATLAARLEKEPGDLEGWRMLSRTYLVTGEPQRAAEALERALSLNGPAADSLKIELAEALVLTETEANVARAREIFDATLKQTPTDPKSLWYTGILALRAGDPELAAQRLQLLEKQELPAEIRAMVGEQLAALGVATQPGPVVAAQPGPVVATQPGPVVAATSGPAQGRAIRIAVRLAPELAARVKPDQVLFVSAREPGIPGPPLAAQRLSAAALPTVVELSDANSMIEGRNLSAVDTVEITARVSISGTAQTSTGDLLGSANVAKAAAQSVDITIDRIVP